MDSDSLATRVESLPEESRKALHTLLDLLAKNSNNGSTATPRHVFKFDWEGGLADAFKGATAVDLQHQGNKWR